MCRCLIPSFELWKRSRQTDVCGEQLGLGKERSESLAGTTYSDTRYKDRLGGLKEREGLVQHDSLTYNRTVRQGDWRASHESGEDGALMRWFLCGSKNYTTPELYICTRRKRLDIRSITSSPDRRPEFGEVLPAGLIHSLPSCPFYVLIPPAAYSITPNQLDPTCHGKARKTFTTSSVPFSTLCVSSALYWIRAHPLLRQLQFQVLPTAITPPSCFCLGQMLISDQIDHNHSDNRKHDHPSSNSLVKKSYASTCFRHAKIKIAISTDNPSASANSKTIKPSLAHWHLGTFSDTIRYYMRSTSQPHPSKTRSKTPNPIPSYQWDLIPHMDAIFLATLPLASYIPPLLPLLLLFNILPTLLPIPLQSWSFWLIDLLHKSIKTRKVAHTSRNFCVLFYFYPWSSLLKSHTHSSQCLEYVHVQTRMWLREFFGVWNGEKGKETDGLHILRNTFPKSNWPVAQFLSSLFSVRGFLAYRLATFKVRD